MKKRVTSLVLALLMALTLLPTTVWAKEVDGGQSVETPVVLRQADGGEVVYMADAANDADTGIATYAAGDDLVERAKAAGFVAIEMGAYNAYDTPGIFRMRASVGLVEGTDYTYTFEDGHLTLKLLPGEVSHWKAALLNCVTSDVLGDTLKFGFSFNRTEAVVYGAMCKPQNGSQRMEKFLNNEYDLLNELPSHYIGYGDNFAIATPELNGSNTEICVEAGARDYLYLVVWQNEAGEYTKYYMNMTVDGGEGFRHTVATPVLRDLAADRFEVDSEFGGGISGGMTSWNITKALGQLSLTPQHGKSLEELAVKTGYRCYHIGMFAVTTPSGGYTLQSYHNVDQATGDNGRNNNPGSGTVFHIGLITSDNVNGSTIRFTLRWANVDPTLPDLVEKLNVRVSPRPWGKLTDDVTGVPNIVDVACLFEYLTKEQKPITGDDMVDPQLADYDLNFDGYVDVYDIQMLYEYVVDHGN